MIIINLKKDKKNQSKNPEFIRKKYENIQYMQVSRPGSDE